MVKNTFTNIFTLEICTVPKFSMVKEDTYVEQTNIIDQVLCASKIFMLSQLSQSTLLNETDLG